MAIRKVQGVTNGHVKNYTDQKKKKKKLHSGDQTTGNDKTWQPDSPTYLIVLICTMQLDIDGEHLGCHH